MAEKPFSRQLGIGVASLTFGAALSIFVYSVAAGFVNTVQAWLLFTTSFLLMLRFWFRYTELFVQFSPSESFWQFLLDFAVSFFGILAVFFVNSIQTWALIGAGAMAASAVRCGLSWNKIKDKKVKVSLKKTLLSSICMLVIFMVIYGASVFVDRMILSEAIFIIVLIFVIYSSRTHN